MGGSLYGDPESPSKTKKLKEKKNTHQEAAQQLQVKKEEVKKYEKIFEDLKKETESEDMKDIVHKFVEYEDKNYALFNFINSLRDESEALNR